MGVKGLTLKKLWHPRHFCVTFMYKKTKQKNKTNEQTKTQAQKKEVDKNKRERYSYYACFNLRNVLFWFYIYSNTEKKCQGLYAWVSCRAFCYKGLLSVIVLVAETHFGLRREFTLEWINEPFDEPKEWLVKWGASYDSMKRWPYWRFYWTVKKKRRKYASS